MTIAQTLIPQFEHEIAVTRKTLERIPDDKFAWRPHAKSMTLQELVSHIAQIPLWTVPTIADSSLDLAPIGKEPYKTPQKNSREEILLEFDKSVSAAMEILSGTSDETMRQPWSLLVAGKVEFTMPKIAVLRSFVLSHLIHHRAQLGIYLRLNDIAHPSMYGPSADEMS